MRICREFFLNTLDLGRDTYLRWVKEIEHDSTETDNLEQKGEDRTLETRREKVKKKSMKQLNNG